MVRGSSAKFISRDHRGGITKPEWYTPPSLPKSHMLSTPNHLPPYTNHIPTYSNHIPHAAKSNIPCLTELHIDLILMPGCIHLAFYTLKISLHRAIFRSVTEFNRSTPAYRPDAKLTAIRVLRFAKKLSSENMQAFWYPCIPPLCYVSHAIGSPLPLPTLF